MSGSLCVHCGFDLALAEGMEDVLLHCPGCGEMIEDAEGLALSGPASDRPTDPFGSSLVPFGAPGSLESRAAIESAESEVPNIAPRPPAPPARPQPPSAVALPLPEVAAGPPAEPPTFNPFLQGAVVPSQLDLAAARAASPLSQARPTPFAAEAKVPVVISGDPHAEFRKGRWQKPALFMAAAALGLVALMTLVPEPEEKGAEPSQAGRQRAPIGGSVSPLIIEEPERDFSAKPSHATPPAGSQAKSGSSSTGNFAESFKSHAK